MNDRKSEENACIKHADPCPSAYIRKNLILMRFPVCKQETKTVISKDPGRFNIVRVNKTNRQRLNSGVRENNSRQLITAVGLNTVRVCGKSAKFIYLFPVQINF